MSEECKYCTYSKECPDIVEHNSIYCKCHKRIPKDRTMSYEQLQQENKQLKENYQAILKQRDDTSKSAVETIEKYQQENEQLKEEIKGLCKKIKVNEKSRRKMQQSLMQQLDLYKSVIDEVREYEESSSFEVDTRDYGRLTVCDADELALILYKVKEGKND